MQSGSQETDQFVMNGKTKRQRLHGQYRVMDCNGNITTYCIHFFWLYELG